jgi:hypothetical protein
MDGKGYGKKRSRPKSRHYPDICRNGLRKTGEHLSPGRNLNAGSPEYEAGVLSSRPLRSVEV